MRGSKTIEGLCWTLVGRMGLTGLIGLLCAWPASATASEPSGEVAPARVGLRVFPVGPGAETASAGDSGFTSSLRALRAALARIAGPGFVLQALRPDPAEGLRLPEGVGLEDRARSLELALEFREAAVAWKELLAQMLSRPLLLTRPQRVARVQLALAAAQAEAGERELALLGFRTALSLDLEARLGPAYPPRARELFAKARAEGALLPSVPRPELVRELAAARDLDAIVWVALGHDRGGEVLLRGFTRTAPGVDLPELRRSLPAERSQRVRLIQREAQALEDLLRAAFPGPAPRTPWYRRAWVLATGGAILATALTTAALFRVFSPARIDVVVQH